MGPSPQPRTLRTGDLVPVRELDTTGGEPLDLGTPGLLTHLQFRRFAGCPVCNLHLRTVVQRHAEITAAGLREVVVFHSTVQELRTHQDGMPLALIADPGKDLYRAFGVESSPRALLNPRAWSAIPRALAASLSGTLRRRNRPAPLNPTGGQLGLPADFLIDPQGRVLAAKYGRHAYDQWTVDELLALARSGVPAG